MRVYVLDFDIDNYRSFAMPIKKERFYILNRFDGCPMSDSWQPLIVESMFVTEKDKRLPISDFPYMSGPPVFSRRAVDLLRDLLEDNGEVLPLNSRDGEFYAFNVTRMLDALDEKRSKIKRFEDGGIWEILEHRFSLQKLTNVTVFKLKQDPNGHTYVTDAFVERVQEKGLQGFKFVEVYSTEE